MEAGEQGVRQSAIPPTNSRDLFDRRPRGGPTMAATLVSPSAPYHHHPHHSSFGSGYPHSAPPTSIPGMISPVEPRRPSDESESSHGHRQSLPSLPSISEVFSNDRKPLAYGAPPSSAPIPPSQSLPSPFSATAPPRPFADVTSPVDKNSSPRTLHPASSNFPRPDVLLAFSDPARPTLATRPVPPPLNTFPGQHPSPPVKLEQLEAEQRQQQLQQQQHAAQKQQQQQGPPQQQPLPGLYTETGRLPPGQLPLSAYPISPRHSGPALPSPYDAQRPPVYGEETEYPHHRPSEYKADFDKHFQTYGYQDALQIVMSSCRTGYHFAEAYVAAAREQQGAQPIPSRMPTENEVSVLLNSLILALKKLEEVRDMVQQNRLQTERASRDSGGSAGSGSGGVGGGGGGGRKPGEDDGDVSMYGDGIKPAYALSEVKKRRGRAAPPGRCHSCNRIDTPEWRRGPDGARTLCNACGLHYAKLERKRQLDQRSLRPKPADERK